MLAIVEIDVKDEDAFTKSGCGPKVGKIITDGGGTYLARGGKVHSVEGNAAKRVAVVRFENVEKARSVFQSEAYRDNRKSVENTATFRVCLAETLS